MAAAIEVPVLLTSPTAAMPGSARGGTDAMPLPGAAMATCGPRSESASARPVRPTAPTVSTWR